VILEFDPGLSLESEIDRAMMAPESLSPSRTISWDLAAKQILLPRVIVCGASSPHFPFTGTLKTDKPNNRIHEPRRPACLSDDELFVELRREKQAADGAFAELYARHSSRIWAYCRCVFGGRVSAEDIFQETFVRFFERGRDGTAVRNVPGYLLMIARNLCLNEKRGRKETVPFENLNIAASDMPLERTELLGLVNSALELLPDEQREAFFLREYEDLPYTEIASILGSTELSARLRVSRARKKIREILQPYMTELAQS